MDGVNLKMEKYAVSRPVLQGAFRVPVENNSLSRAPLGVDTLKRGPFERIFQREHADKSDDLLSPVISWSNEEMWQLRPSKIHSSTARKKSSLCLTISYEPFLRLPYPVRQQRSSDAILVPRLSSLYSLNHRLSSSIQICLISTATSLKIDIYIFLLSWRVS